MDLTDRECEVFARYLIGQKVGDYVRAKYREFHSLPAAGREFSYRPFDRTLLALARRHPLATRLADAYARVALPAGVLRKKLVLLFAILESCTPWEQHFRAGPPVGGVRLWAGLVLTGACSVAVLLTSVVLLGPGHALAAAAARFRRRRAASPEAP